MLELTDQLNGTTVPADAAKITDKVVDHQLGALIRLQEFTEAAAEWCRDQDPERGDDLYNLFGEAAERLADLSTELAGAPSQIRALSGPEEPETPRAQAARSASPALADRRDLAPAPTVPPTRADATAVDTPRRQR